MKNKEMKDRLIYNAEIVGGTHGLTCIFPTLRDIVDYEENKRVPIQGYPRFIPHPFVVAVQEKHKWNNFEVIAIQTPEAASFVHSNYFDAPTRDHSEVVICNNGIDRYGVIYVTNEYAKSALSSITNAGVILNSRKAQRILESKKPSEKCGKLPQMLSNLEEGSSPDLTFLFTSGIAAIYCAINGFLREKTGAVVIGNTYVDTWKLLNNLPSRFSFKPTIFYNSGSKIDIPNGTSIVFLEIPTNPLLQIEDLASIVNLAHKKGAVVIVDSTIASPFHFSPFEYDVDIIVHSTSKSLSGKNNHMGGVLFVNSQRPDLAQNILHLPFELDVDEEIILLENLRNFTERIQKMSENAIKIVEYLMNNPIVSKAYYPTGLKNGNGHVVSFELKDDSYEIAEVFYDNCTIQTKGPSMGLEKSMLMPYALITHYHDSIETLVSLGLKRYIMRLSVGTENPDIIIQNLANGLNAVAKLNS
ncbi:PLP-dependent transferase [Flavobacterium sp. UBA6031]|uniref:PLP-dependent transferase n=1 Tax=Flavobacterium sp. UBA6031 TaxID=1946551 RepID=UPI0025C157AE|nr:PLP-dependent transferase [Flavobacterium sp. UBA6031]